MKWWIVIIAN